MRLKWSDMPRPIVCLAPMDGITDSAYRQLVRRFSADVVLFSEFTSADGFLRSEKLRGRLDFKPEEHPYFVQLFGNNPQSFAEASRQLEQQGVAGIDINMGCPAKKVCRVDAGSSLLKDTSLVRAILESVVRAVPVPVTLKIRTGWSRRTRNALEVARIAEDCGIQALTVHGRTREDKFSGEAEYATVRRVKQSVGIPVIANGDIDSAKKAKMVLDFTATDAIMVGRVAQQRPWIFHQMEHYLKTGQIANEPTDQQKKAWLLDHLKNLYLFYGEFQGVQIARKHINWQLGQSGVYRHVKTALMQATTADNQLGMINIYFEQWFSGRIARAS